MIKTIDLRSWPAFKRRIEDLYSEAERLRKKGGHHVSNPLFRGLPDSGWCLETTLEREIGANLTLEKYYHHHLVPALRALSQTFTLSLPCPLPPLPALIRDIQCNLPLYEEMAALRHHGFPSPLLDWSRSPYVAAFFAFSPLPSKRVKRVAIFAFQDVLGNGHSYSSASPFIRRLGRWGSVHGRHWAQQSEYTIAVHETDKGIAFHSHDAAFGGVEHNQDRLIKYTLPLTERERAIQDLVRMNVTEHSLFGTTDSLVRTIARFTQLPEH